MRSVTGWCAALAAATILGMGFASPVSAQSATLYLNSQPGDYIGQGRQQTFTDADGPFIAISSQGTRHVNVSFHTPSYSHWWYLDFGAASGTSLVPGAYEGATRYAFQSPVGYGLDVYGEGRGCNRLTGRFVVLEAVYDGSGNVLQFAADFEQHCEGTMPALFGAIRFNSGVSITPRLSVSNPKVLEGDTGASAATFTVALSGPLATPVQVSYATADGTALAGVDYHPVSGTINLAPGEVARQVPVTVVANTTVQPDRSFALGLTNAAGAPVAFDTGQATILDDDTGKTLLFMASQPGDYIGGGITRTLMSLDGSFVTGLSGNHVSVDFNGASSSWNVHMQAPNADPLLVGTYENARRWPFQPAGQPGLSVYGDGRGCNMLSGRFVVREVEVDGGGGVVRFAADFEQHCEFATPALFGSIRINSLVPVPYADLSITKTDGLASVARGQHVAYVITATNAGPAAVAGATVADTVPTSLLGATWTCVGLGGGTCASSGSGNLSDTVDLPPGASVTYTMRATVSPSASGNIGNTASINAPPGPVTDPTLANNTATDTDSVLAPPGPCTASIADGGFEAGFPWPAWTEQFSTNFGTPLCDFSCGTGGGTSPPYAGSNWAWFGGTPVVPESATLGQWVTLPACDVRLRFWMRVGYVTTPFTDTLVVYVDGAPVRTFNEPPGPEPAYTQREIDLTPYADGGTHPLRFTFTHPDFGLANFAVDNIELTATIPQADLSITKTDGSASAFRGQAITYSMVVSNAGPSAVSGARVTDLVPAAITGASWTCTGTGGAVCAANGSGSIDDTVNLPVGATAVYTLTGTVHPTAAGSLANTASVTPPSGVTDPDIDDNSATDIDVLLSPADLYATITDGQDVAAPGQVLTYTIVAGNLGPNGVAGASVSAPLPSGLTAATWTCSPSGGASCTPSGSGGISDTVDLPIGGTVTYVLAATVAPAPATATYTVIVSWPAGFGDPNPANNAAADADFLNCASYRVLVADGRLTEATVAAGATAWFVVSLREGASYSASFENVLDTGAAPAVTVFRGDDGCTGTSTLFARDTTLVDPASGPGAVRLGFTATGAEPLYRVRVLNGSPTDMALTLGVGETTLFSAAWSTNGGFDTFYSLQNTTGETLNGVLTLRDTTGSVMGDIPMAIPAGQTMSANTASLGIVRNRTGTARFTHDGPPGAVAAEAAIANFSLHPAYVQPATFRAVREGR